MGAMHDFTTLQKALQQTPDNVQLWLLFGEKCIADLALVDARRAFEAASALNPNEPAALLGIARVFYHEGKFSEAEVRTQGILRDHQSFAPGHVLMSRIYLAEGDRRTAREHYELATVLSKSVADVELEQQLLAVNHRDPVAAQIDDFENRPRLVAESGWDDDLDLSGFPDSIDDELSSFEASGVEQEEFDFVDEELGFDFDEFERPKGNFSDVAGMEDVKEELRMKLIHPYAQADLFRAYGKKPGGGVLLYGPPGCGKSLVCRALAGETNAAFYSIKLHQILEMYLGCSEKNLHCFFHEARQNAPAVIFIDELDALAANRSDIKQNAARAVVNQFLMELDGFDGANEGLLVIATTSAIGNIDPAFLRPGRFSRRILVPPPDHAARVQILKLQARNRPVGNLDYDLLASMLEDFSGADIAQVFDLAIEDALRIAMLKGDVVPISTEMLKAASQRVEPTVSLWREPHEHGKR